MTCLSSAWSLELPSVELGRWAGRKVGCALEDGASGRRTGGRTGAYGAAHGSGGSRPLRRVSLGGEERASLWLGSPPCWGGRRGVRLGEAVGARRRLSSGVVAPSVAAGAILQAKLPFV